MTGVFSEDVVVERVADGRYRAVLDHSWDLMPLPQGGIVASFGLRAAAAAVADSTQQLRTCTAVFAGRVTAGDLEIEATVLRRGRSATQVSATVRNPESAAGTTVLAVFGSDRRGPSFVDVAPPRVPPPSECRSYRGTSAGRGGAVRDAALLGAGRGSRGLGHAPWDEFEPSGSDVATWLRFDDPPLRSDGSLDPLGVLTLADRMPGSVGEAIGYQGERWFAPSADLTVHFFEPARTRWLLAHDRARWAADGWASAETTLWDEEGTLVAYATQMMIYTYVTEPH